MTEPSEFTHSAKKNHPVRTTLLVMVTIMVVGAVAAGSYLFSLASTFNNSTQKIDQAFPDPSVRPSKAPAAENGLEAVNILLLGHDSVGNTGGEFIEGRPNSNRSDAMMLMHVPADREDIFVMSLMRDLWTEIPGHGEAKLNAAFAFGGAPLTVQTIEGLFEARIDHVAIIDFEGFTSLTDALGGVEVAITQPFDSYHMRGKHFEAGTQTLEGEEALAFVRERYAFADGDYQRVRNQQLFVEGVMAKFLTPDTLTNPARLHNVVSRISPYITVDGTLDAGRVAGLGLELKDVRRDNIHMFTLPTAGIGTSPDGQSIVLKDELAINEIGEAIRNGSLDDYIDETF